MPLTWLFGFVALYLLPTFAMSVVAIAVGDRDDGEGKRLTALTAGLGPLSASWALVHGLTLFPGSGPAVIAGFALLPSLAVLALARRHVAPAVDVWRSLGRSLLVPFRRGERAAALVPLAASVAICAAVSSRALLLPLTENDAMEYASLARYLFERLDPGVYPVLEADAKSGFYYSVSHPLGYPGMLLSSMLLQGASEMTPFVKLVGPAYLGFLLLALAGALAGRGPVAILTASLLVVAAPAYAAVVGDLQIDPMRIYPFFVALALVPWLAARDGRGSRMLAALAVAMALYTHSMGVLVVPLFALAYLHETRRRGLRSLLVVVAVASLLAGWRYVDNFRLYGSPISNMSPLFQSLDLRFQEYIRYGRELQTVAARFRASLLRGFVDIGELGLVFWLALAAGLGYRRILLADRRAVAFLWVGAGYAAMALVALLLNVDLFALNVRHYLTLVPFAAYLVGVVMPLAPSYAAAAVTLAALSLFPARATFDELRKFPVNRRTLSMSDAERMRQAPGVYAHAHEIRERFPEDASFLVLRFSDFAYYVRRRMISDQDVRLLPVYRAGGASEAHARLLELGVDYVYQPGYTPPTVGETPLGLVLADPTLVELVYANGYHRVYRVRRVAAPAPATGVPEGPGCAHADFRAEDTYRMSFDAASGRGYLSVTVREYGESGRVEAETPLWDGLLSAKPRTIGGLFRLSSRRTCGVQAVRRLSSGAVFHSSPVAVERIAQPDEGGAGASERGVELRSSR